MFGHYEESEDDNEEFDDNDDRERAAVLRAKLPPNYGIREVSGSHRKPCSECGLSDFFPGSFYIYDHVNPWGSDKFCLDCAEMRFGGGFLSSEDDDEYDEDDVVTAPPMKHADGGTYDASGWQSWPPVESGEWGLVYVARGHLRGRFVYYDDEEDEDEAIVYVGRPLVSDCYTVRLSSLRQPPFAGALRSGMGAHDGEPTRAPAAAPAPAPLAALAAPPAPEISGQLRDLRSSSKRGSPAAASAAQAKAKRGRK